MAKYISCHLISIVCFYIQHIKAQIEFYKQKYWKLSNNTAFEQVQIGFNVQEQKDLENPW